MSAHETARMSACSAAAIVGSDTMNTRVATPEMNCPIMALASSSASVRGPAVRVVIRAGDGSCRSARTEVALGVAEQRVECGRRLDHPGHDAGTVALQPVAVGRMPATGDDHDEVVGAGRDRPRVEMDALAHHLAGVDLDPGRTAGPAQVLERNAGMLEEELADGRLRPA